MMSHTLYVESILEGHDWNQNPATYFGYFIQHQYQWNRPKTYHRVSIPQLLPCLHIPQAPSSEAHRCMRNQIPGGFPIATTYSDLLRHRSLRR